MDDKLVQALQPTLDRINLLVALHTNRLCLDIRREKLERAERQEEKDSECNYLSGPGMRNTLAQQRQARRDELQRERAEYETAKRLEFEEAVDLTSG